MKLAAYSAHTWQIFAAGGKGPTKHGLRITHTLVWREDEAWRWRIVTKSKLFEDASGYATLTEALAGLQAAFDKP